REGRRRAVFVVGRLRPGHPRAVHEERRVVPEPRPQGAPGQLVHARTHAPKVLLRRTTQPLDLEGLPHRAVTPPPSFARRAPAVVPPLSFHPAVHDDESLHRAPVVLSVSAHTPASPRSQRLPADRSRSPAVIPPPCIQTDGKPRRAQPRSPPMSRPAPQAAPVAHSDPTRIALPRSEEHTSELQSRENLVCRLLLEKKN